MPTKGIVCELAKKKKERKMQAVTVVIHCCFAFVMFASSSGRYGLQLEKHSCLEHQHTFIPFIMNMFMQTRN